MFDIDKFIHEKISVCFDTMGEFKEAIGILNKRHLISYEVDSSVWNQDVCLMYGWISGHKEVSGRSRVVYGSIKYAERHGWKAVKFKDMSGRNCMASDEEILALLKGGV